MEDEFIKVGHSEELLLPVAHLIFNRLVLCNQLETYEYEML